MGVIPQLAVQEFIGLVVRPLYHDRGIAFFARPEQVHIGHPDRGLPFQIFGKVGRMHAIARADDGEDLVAGIGVESVIGRAGTGVVVQSDRKIEGNRLSGSDLLFSRIQR